MLNPGRRRFLKNATLLSTGAQLALTGSALVTPGKVSAQGATSQSKPAAPSFASLRQIDAGLLRVAYAEAGPASGPAVILLHGWPYGIHSFVDVAPILAGGGYHVIVPYLRGYGGTQFLSRSTMRNGQPAAVSQDIVDLMDALGIKTATLGGFDWGARSADIVAALWRNAAKGWYR